MLGRSRLPGRSSPGTERSSSPGAAAPGKRVALTFDDGPDPRWTPRIVAALQRLHAPATFFVVGSEVVRHPDLVRRLHRDGFELGNHTFTHADLSALPDWEQGLQIGLTENALVGTVGFRARLVRPPYSSVPSAVSARQEQALSRLARDGYDVVLADFDGEDWRRPGVDEIVAGATPQGNRGGIVLLHDGGGDRSQTVSAIERLVPALRARGFRFVPVSELGGLSREQVELPEGRWGRARGRLLIATLAVARWTTSLLGLLLVAVTLLFVARIFLLFAFARRHVRLFRGQSGTELTPPVSVIVPAFNEAVDIERAVSSLAASDYPDLEIVVVDDGSTDGTGDLVERLGLPHVRLLRQPNAGKPAALNHGIAETSHEIVVMVDADTVFEPDTLRHLVQPFASAEIGAVSGNTKVGNRRGLLGRWQHIEYVMGFNLDRRLFDVLQCMPTVPGAVGAFRRRALAERGRRLRRDARGGHRPHAGDRPGRVARRLRGGRPRVDGGACDSPGALATALPLVLRNDPVGLEAPGRDLAARRGTDRPARLALSHPLPDRAAAARSADRPLLDLRVPLPEPGWRARLLGRLHDASARAGLVRVPARPGIPPGPVGDAAPAVRLPPAHVPGRDRVGAHGVEGIQAPLAPDRAQRRDRGRELGQLGLEDDHAAEGRAVDLIRVAAGCPKPRVGRAIPLAYVLWCRAATRPSRSSGFASPSAAPCLCQTEAGRTGRACRRE